MIQLHDFKDIITAAAKSGRAEPVRHPADQDEDTASCDMSVRVFKNGNGHLIFGEKSLRVVNNALAEYYGEVLPDAWDRPDSPDITSTAVAADLQFYRTPDAIADDMAKELDYVSRPGMRILDPSCGDGALLDAVARRFRDAKTVGIEVHRERALKAAERHAVTVRNFLSVEPAAIYDGVVMNPPFYGTHWSKHLRHAWKFVRPGGQLVTILPASAVIDHMDKVVKALEYKGKRIPYTTLPLGAFKESGTNICTVMVTMRKDNRSK